MRTALPASTGRGPAHRAQAAGELAQEIMLVESRAGLVLVEQGELELLHLLKVVVEDELLGERGVEVVDGRFCPVVLAEGQGSRSPSQAAGSALLGLPEVTRTCWTPTLGRALGASDLGGRGGDYSQLTGEDTDTQRGEGT